MGLLDDEVDGGIALGILAEGVVLAQQFEGQARIGHATDGVHVRYVFFIKKLLSGAMIAQS